jgi:hypothetical protein
VPSILFWFTEGAFNGIAGLVETRLTTGPGTAATTP